MSTLGLDVGDVRIGVAVGDAENILASPRTTIVRDDDSKAIQSIVKIANERNATRIIVGLPYSLNGTLGTQAKKVLDFIELLSSFTTIAIETWDERLSTKAVEALMRSAGKNGRKIRQQRDAAAAAYILQGYLDSQDNSGQ